MRLWPQIAELQAETRRRLTPRRLGWLEAISAPCISGGEETRDTLAVERAILFGPEWVARRMVRGSVWVSAFLSLFWRPRDARAAWAKVRNYIDRELWYPERFVRDGEKTTDAKRLAFGSAWRLAVIGARHGFGSPSRWARRSVWDASCAEIVAHAVCSAELDRTAEFETREEHEHFAALAEAVKHG